MSKKRLKKKYGLSTTDDRIRVRNGPLSGQGDCGASGGPVDAEEQATMGRDYFAAGRYKEAIAAWGSIRDAALKAELAVARAEALFRLSLEQHAAGKEDAALTYLQQAASLAPGRAIYWYHLGLAFHRKENFRRAEEAYRQSLAMDPAFIRALFHLGLLWVQQLAATGRPADTAEGGDGHDLTSWMQNQGGKLSPEQWEFLLAAAAVAGGQPLPSPAGGTSRLAGTCLVYGLTAFLGNQWEEAHDRFTEAARLDAANPGPWLFAATAKFHLGRMEEALAAWEQALALGAPRERVVPCLAAARNVLLARAAGERDVERIISILEKERQQAPVTGDVTDGGQTLGLAYFCRGNRWAREEEWDQAVADWQRALATGLTDPDVLHNLALAHEKLENYPEAIRYWRSTITAWTDLLKTGEDGRPLRKYLALAYHRLAELLLETGESDESVSDLRLSIQYDPTDIQTRLDLAEAYMSSDEPLRAITELRELLKRVPDHLEGLIAIGAVYMKMNRREESAKALERALEVSPGHRVAQKLLVKHHGGEAIRLITARDLPGARARLQLALQIDPADEMILSLFGFLEHREGNPVKGDRWFTRAVKQRPEHPAGYLSVGQMLLKLGLDRRADNYLRKGLARSEGDAQTLVKVGILYLEHGQEKKARQHFDGAIMAAAEPGIFLDVHEACCQSEACDLAIDYARQASRRYPRMTEFSILLLKCLVHRKRTTEARAVLPGVQEMVATRRDKQDKAFLRELTAELAWQERHAD